MSRKLVALLIISCSLMHRVGAAESSPAQVSSTSGTQAVQTDFVPITYMNPNPPKVVVPSIQGASSTALVPDTTNLEEIARLLLEGYLINITEPRADYEPYNRGRFEVLPPRITLDIGTYLCALPKYREMLPLLRIMSGSQKGLEIDRAWAENIAKCIGPDGLYYVPRQGRPWDDINWNGEHTGYWWKMPADVPFYTHLSLPNGRLLGSLALYYKLTGDEQWRTIRNAVVDRLAQLALHRGRDAFFPKFNWLPNEQLTEEQKQAAIESAYSETTEESDGNKSLWQTWIIVGLSQYYASTGYEPARELARGLISYLRTTKYIENWGSHFHCITLGIHGMLEFANATNDRELGEYARRAYDYAKNGGELVALPEIGFFVNTRNTWAQGDKSQPRMEGCSIGDMTAIAVKLATLNLSDDYWEDVDRYTRNMLTEIQRKTPAQSAKYFSDLASTKSLPTVPVAYHENANDIPQKMVGTFAQNSLPSEMFPSSYFDSCCIGNIGRALYYVWEHIIEKTPDGLTLRLLLNRTSPWADIDSFIPYKGEVQINLKIDAPTMRIRLNNWIDRDQIKVTRNGVPLQHGLEGNYLLLSKLTANDKIVLTFPIQEVAKTLQYKTYSYDAVFRGNDCVSIQPQGRIVPLFQRSRFREANPAFVNINRFTYASPILY